MDSELYFFCTSCKDKTESSYTDRECLIEQTVKTYKRGEYIAYQGDKVTSLLMLTKGKVKTEIIATSGLTLSVDLLSAPYPLAAAFLFAHNNHFPVDVVALEECEIILFSKSTIEKQIATCPEFLRGFMAFIANRVEFLSDRLKIFSQKGIKAKISYYILKRDKQGHFEFDRTVASLAEYFGVKRPSLSRAISEMVRDGMIEFESGKGNILDYNKLKDEL